MIELKYFKPVEFMACVPSCSILQMDSDFLYRLDMARAFAQVPFILTSAYRSSEYDRSKGRSGNGFHTKGLAVDVVCKDSFTRRRIIAGCIEYGLTCGLSKDGFVHIDDRESPIVFLY